MKVYFLRHGVAAEREEWAGTDFDRPLTGEGCERMERQARTMAKLSLSPEVIITSPLVRAKQTAAIVAERLKSRGGVVEDVRLGLDFDLTRLTGILDDHRSAQAVMLVGHDPSMSETIGEFVGGARIDLKKGSLACVEVPDALAPEGKLMWLVPPKALLL